MPRSDDLDIDLDPEVTRQLRAHCQELLVTHGPLPVRELHRAVTSGQPDDPAPDLVGSDDIRDGEVVAPDLETLTPAQLRHLLLDDRDPDAFAAFPLFDDRLCDIDALLDGLTLTHEVSDDERASGTLARNPDLSVLGLASWDATTIPAVRADDLRSDDLRSDDVRSDDVRSDSDDERADTDVIQIVPGGLILPDGWLTDQPALSFRWQDGHVEVRTVTQLPEPDEQTVERLAKTVEAIRDDDGTTDALELLVEARARYPTLLDRPHAPLRDLLTAADLRCDDDGTIADPFDDPFDDPVGNADDAAQEAEAQALIDHLTDAHGLGPQEIQGLLEVAEACQQLELAFIRRALERFRDWRDALLDDDEDADDGEATDMGRGPDLAAPGPDLDAFITGGEAGKAAKLALETIDVDTLMEHLAAVLADRELTVLLDDEVLDDDPLALVSLQILLVLTEEHLRLDRRQRANVAWLRARSGELLDDDHLEVERHLRRVVELDPDHGAAYYELAAYLSDRGQPGAALGLLRQLESHEELDAFTDLLATFADEGPVSAARNDPCPCGSGRKYKSCCADANGWPLQLRTPWVWHKLTRYLLSRPGKQQLREVVAATGGARSAEPDVAVINLAVFEGGLLADMVARRGPLLPADERDLLERWAQVRASAYEVVDISDQTVTFLDLRSGDRISFFDRSLSRGVRVGTAVLAWLVPEPKGLAPAAGVVQIPETHRRHVLDLLDDDPDVWDLAAWFLALASPPQIATTSGDAMVAVTETYALVDVDAARQILTEHLDQQDEDRFVAHEERDGRAWIKGNVTLDPERDRLTVETLSVPRATWFAEFIARELPDAHRIDAVRIPIEELRGRDGDGDDTDAGAFDLDALDPDERGELEAELNAMMEAHEDRWVDDEIPALDGLTPRQAAADPTRRGQLLRLLDDIERHEELWNSPGRPMSAARLRSLLDL